MIILALLAAQDVQTSAVAPAEFRRKVALHHMCVTDQPTDTGYKEVGLLHLERGENVADVALKKPANQPPMFEKGIVTAVRSEKEPEMTRLIASLDGERGGRPAQLEIKLTFKKGDGMGVSLNLAESGKSLQFSCFRQIRDVPS